MKEYLSQVSPDTLFLGLGNIIGSFFGAFLAGGFALLILYSEIRARKKDSYNKRQEKLIRVYYSIINLLKLTNSIMKMVNENIFRDEKWNRESISHIERYLTDIEKIDEDDIPVELLEKFLEAKRVIKYFGSLYKGIDASELYTPEGMDKELMKKQIDSEILKRRIINQSKLEEFIEELENIVSKIDIKTIEKV